MKENNAMFESMPVPKAVAKSALPAVVSMLVVLIYNLADTFFVGQTGDPLQVAAVSVATPVFLLMMAVGLLFGVGGTSVISRALGTGNTARAKKASAFCFYAALIAGVLFIVGLELFLEPVLKLAGASADTMELAKSYLSCVALGAPLVVVSNAFSNIVRAEGKSTIAMTGMLLGTAINIVLDPVMILGLGWGVAGAAWATVIGNAVSTVYYVVYLLGRKTQLSIHPKALHLPGRVWGGVFAIGVPACLNSVLMSVSNILLNNVLAAYGDLPVAAMGIAMKVNMVVALLLIGFCQGVQPLLGYSYGAGDSRRFRQIMKFSFSCTVVLGVVMTAVCWLGAESIVRAFLDNEAVFAQGAAFVKALLVSGPVLGILFLFTNALEAMGAAVPSLVLSISRQGLVFVPMLYLLNAWVGLTGAVYAQPLADYLSIFISGLLFVWQYRKFRRWAGKKQKANGNITLAQPTAEPGGAPEFSPTAVEL